MPSLAVASASSTTIKASELTTLPDDIDPVLQEILDRTHGGELTKKMGITFVELSAESSVARMPVVGNTQIIGLLHGGAHVVLGESLGSISAAIHAGPGRYAVGIEINATHSRSVTSGWVTGTCHAISLGRTLASHEIIITDDDGHRLSTVRMTNLLRNR
ncbi:MAG: PaaI family thioesterase [Rhodoglobus sp.]